MNPRREPGETVHLSLVLNQEEFPQSEILGFHGGIGNTDEYILIVEILNFTQTIILQCSLQKRTVK